MISLGSFLVSTTEGERVCVRGCLRAYRTCYHDLCLEVGLFEPLDCLGELVRRMSAFLKTDDLSRIYDQDGYGLSLRMMHNSYLGITPLVGQVSGMDENVPLGQLDRAVVCVGYADESRPTGHGGSCAARWCGSRLRGHRWQCDLIPSNA